MTIPKRGGLRGAGGVEVPVKNTGAYGVFVRTLERQAVSATLQNRRAPPGGRGRVGCERPAGFLGARLPVQPLLGMQTWPQLPC